MCTTEEEEEEEDEFVDCSTSGALSPQLTFTESVELAETLPLEDFLPSLTSLSLTLEVRPLCQRGTTRLWYRSLLPIETEPSPWPAFATSHRRKRLRQAHERLFLSLCQRPIYMATKASLSRRNHVPWNCIEWETLKPKLHDAVWKQN